MILFNRLFSRLVRSFPVAASVALTLGTAFSISVVRAAPPGTPPTAQLVAAELRAVGVERFTDAGYRPGLERHLVLFRYADWVTPAQRNEVKRRFLLLQRLAVRGGRPYVVSIETGGQNSGEGAEQNLEQGFIVTFRSQGDRNFYVGQPVVTDPRFYDATHQAFKEFVGPLLSPQGGALVFDFATETAAGALFAR